MKEKIHHIILSVFRNFSLFNKLIKTLPRIVVHSIQNEVVNNTSIDDFKILQPEYTAEIENVNYNIADNIVFEEFRTINYPAIFTCTFSNVIVCAKSGFIIDTKYKKVYAETNPYKEEAISQYDFYYSLRPSNIKKINSINPFFLVSTNNYCHWFSEFLPILLNIYKNYINPEVYITKLVNKWQIESIKMLGININNLIQIEENTNYLFFSKLNFISFGGYGAGIPDVKNILMVKHLLIKGLNDKCSFNLPKIYISRRKANHRKVVNEAEFEKFLRKKGFVTLYMEDYFVQKQFNIMNNASIIIAVHGPSLVNTIVCEDSHIIELANENHITASFFRFATIANNKYFLLKCKSIGEPKAINNHKFYGYCDIEVDVNQINNLLYSIEASLI